ncbi:hypothetical protein [Streptomyces sp. NBC_01304]|uniref:hypothetical protein n=1 Tax=Streptomyces sp. NBC_01304 TaxID=2903818 RepID=UPI002E149BB7|nr:hypothetical protein OG430_49035 [Streptomyces sp. NBC_01304]
MRASNRATVSGRTYTRTRPRGFAPWRPAPATRRLVEQVQAVLAEYDAFLPMTARQVFYALVGNYQYPKDERAYARLQEAINRARRAGLIPMDSIRDDRAVVLAPDPGFASPEEFRRTVLDRAAAYTRPLDEGQPRAVEVWVEAVGAMPMIATVAHEFGVTVYGSGGFESVAAKHDAAQRIAARPVVTTVLSLGDLDPSGWSIVDAAADDVAVFAEQLGAEPPTVSRLAVTEQQVRRYQLPTAPQKATDRRGAHMEATVQAEALSPAQLTTIVRTGLEAVLDLDQLAWVRRRSTAEREQLQDQLRRLQW